MGCFQVNNFDANWKFNPPNLLGGKNSHNNRNQGAVRTSPDAGYGMDAAMSNCSRHSEDVETEGYDSPCFCGAGTMEAGEMPGMPGISYERGSPVPRGPGESRARRAVPVNGGSPAPRESPVPRVLREPPALWAPEGNRAPAGRQGLRAIPRAAYSPRLRARSCSCRRAPAFRSGRGYRTSQGTYLSVTAAPPSWLWATMPFIIISPQG